MKIEASYNLFLLDMAAATSPPPLSFSIIRN